MNIRFPSQLTEHLKTLAPVEGVRIVNPDDRSSWQIIFAAAASAEQQAAAQSALLAFEAPPEVAPLTGDDIAAILKQKGVLTDNDIKVARDAKARR